MPSKQFIVKVQRPIGGDDRGQALISDEAESIYYETEMTDALRQKMKFDLKVYFYATIAGGNLAIGRRAP